MDKCETGYLPVAASAMALGITASQMGLPLPRIQVGPIGGIALWLFVILLFVGFVGGITVLGAVTFAVIGAVVLATAVVFLSRVVNRLLGRRARRR